MNQLADNKKLMDFLLYSYFGFSSGDLDQTKKVKCSYRAYLDLARKVQYTSSSKKPQSKSMTFPTSFPPADSCTRTFVSLISAWTICAL